MRLFASGIATAVAVAACLLTPSFASAEPEPVSEAEAVELLEEVEDAGALDPLASDPTVALRDLAMALPALDGAAERRARQILARPPDGSSPYGGSWPNNAEEQFVEQPSFVVHYAEVPGCNASPPKPDNDCDEPNLADGDTNGIPDYVDATVAAVEESIAVENGELGWPLPKGDGTKGEPPGSSEEDRFDVYLSDLCDEGDFNPCVFGFAQRDDNSATCTSAPFECSGHLVLDNDYSEFGDSGGELGLRVTTAHEYNHVLQFGIDANQDGWMFESTATWSEEQVFPDDDDWIRTYMDDWTRESEIPLTRADRHWYGSAVWNHWLEHGDHSYGPDVVLNAWESSRDVTPKDYAVGAYDDAIKDEGGDGFPQEFAAFAAATAEWRTGDGGFPDAAELPGMKRSGKLSFGGKSKARILDNTSFQLFNVNPKGAQEITLKGKNDGGGVQWGLALVGRQGGSTSGTVERVVSYTGGAEKQTATLENAQGFDRITAVVANADGRVAGPKPTGGQFTYTANDEDFKLRVK